ASSGRRTSSAFETSSVVAFATPSQLRYNFTFYGIKNPALRNGIPMTPNVARLPEWYQRLAAVGFRPRPRQPGPLTDAHRALIELLAEVAVERHFAGSAS